MIGLFFFVGFEPAAIFLGAIGGTAIILIILYFCIKSDKCFCQVSKGDDSDEPEDVEYAKVASEDSGTEISDYTTPANLKDAKYVKSTGDISNMKLMSSDDDELAPGVAQVGEVVSEPGDDKTKTEHLMPPQRKSKSKKKQRRSQSMEDPKRGLGSLHMSLQYSKKDLFLFVVIHKLTDLHPAEVNGIDQVRVSMVLLPAKRSRSKTKFVSTNEPEFGASFKFSNVSKADLFQSAMRFRLYGRHVRLGIHLGKEKLMGEVTVHLADVAQRERITTSRPFKPPGK